jgi:hypothetical protein
MPSLMTLTSSEPAPNKGAESVVYSDEFNRLFISRFCRLMSARYW